MAEAVIAPGEFLVRMLRELDAANRQLVLLLKQRRALRDARYDHSPPDYARRLAELQAEIDQVIVQIQSLHDLVKDIRD